MISIIAIKMLYGYYFRIWRQRGRQAVSQINQTRRNNNESKHC